MQGWLASVLATVALVGTAAAQAPPTPLIGPPSMRLERAPGMAPGPLPQERPSLERVERQRRESGISARPLPALDGESAGWNESEGGLGAALWQGSRWAAVERLLDLLPAAATTPARLALARRLVMSASVRPEATPAGAFAERRMAALMALGDAAAAATLGRRLTVERLPAAVGRLAAEAEMASGGRAEACRAARRPEADADDLFWRKLRIACDALDIQYDRVVLGLDLLREQGKDPGDAFTALVEAAVGEDKPATAAMPDVLSALLATSAGIPPAPGAQLPIVIAAMVARAEKLKPADRLPHAERAAAVGLIDGALFTRLYVELPVDQKGLGAVPAVEAGAAGPAALLQQALLQMVPGLRLERLAAGWRRAVTTGAPFAYAQAASPLVAEISPSADLMPYAPAVIRIALAGGDVHTALRWTEAVGARMGDAMAAETYQGAVALLRLAMGDEGPEWNPTAADRWATAMGGTQAPRTLVGLTLFAALGEAAGGDAWLGFPHAPSTPPPDASLLFALEAAARERRLGEQTALALTAMGGALVPHPLAASAAIKSLRFTDQAAAARHIALEIALAAGL
ncbi:MAG: hypothetical protein AB7P02_00870 [Alphaproteobacteria bacterium]